VARKIKDMLASGGITPAVDHIAPSDILTPADRYQELFTAIQTSRIFPDGKTFVDSHPKSSPAIILETYRATKDRPNFDLATFVQQNFAQDLPPDSHYISDPKRTITAHIDALWPVLTRHPERHARRSSLLPLPHSYIVPGGRFGEMYYWDSYFTMLGLAHSGQHGLMRTMADNFAFLIDTYGHIPNGNRTYYLSRSQPPVFALMVDLLEAHGVRQGLRYLPQLKREYAYWMEGAETLAPGQSHRYVVRMPDGSLLNRYWDDRNTPREESYLEDVTTAEHGARPAAEIYRDLRAGAASGWDFSSRWLDNPHDLSTIRTTAILPVDLNSFLHKLETQIEHLSALAGDAETKALFQRRARKRLRAINRYLWDDTISSFIDYDWLRDRPRDALSAAIVVPLYVGLATTEQAHKAARIIQDRLLAHGGLITTEQHSSQQWDKSNGWAPLQWMAIGGLKRYGLSTLSHDIAQRWLTTVGAIYEREGKLVEKYAISSHADGPLAGGGEYPLQDGFGWTNGITRRLMQEHPTHHLHHIRPRSGHHR